MRAVYASFTRGVVAHACAYACRSEVSPSKLAPSFLAADNVASIDRRDVNLPCEKGPMGGVVVGGAALVFRIGRIMVCCWCVLCCDLDRVVWLDGSWWW